MGSRFGGLKQMEAVGPSGETLLDYSVFDAVRAGFTDIVFVIRRDFEMDFRKNIGERYEKFIRVAYAFQSLDDLPTISLKSFQIPKNRQKPWGTAHAILAARDAVKTNFLAINADDFYGRDAYARLAEHFAASEDCAMAGYRLDRTLSDNGTVSRGVCTTDVAGFLHEVTEFTTLRTIENGGVVDEKTQRVFHGDESVSLNFWGLTPAVFPLLGKLFAEFLALYGEEEKSEFYIPSAITALVSSGNIRMKVLPTNSEWFGVTYREDAPAVRTRLAELVASGEYPTPLWGN